MYDRKHGLPCFNHPDFRKWWMSIVENLVMNYELDGIQFGFERSTTLHHVMKGNTIATCFCSHCVEKAHKYNIDDERAKEGYRKLYEFLEKVEFDNYRPSLGVFPQVLRLWTEYPEILAWEKQEISSKEEIYGQLYGTAKVLDPGIEFGLHLPDSVCRNMFSRAVENYGDMVEYSDFQKLIVYHEIEG